MQNIMRKRIDMFYALSYSSVIGAAHRTELGEAAITSGAGSTYYLAQ